MKTILLCLMMVAIVLSGETVSAETWEQFQKLKAAEEEDDMVAKTGPRLISKDLIMEGLKKEGQFEFRGDVLLFHYGLPKLKDESLRNLQSMAQALKEAATHPQLSKIKTYSVDGHTCSIGSASNNCRLSWARSQAVIDELTKLGVQRDRLAAKGYGLAYPAHSNDSEDSRKQNRRVVLKAASEQTASHSVIPCQMSGDRRPDVAAPERSSSTVPSQIEEAIDLVKGVETRGVEGKRPSYWQPVSPNSSGSGASGSQEKSESLPRGFIKVK